MVIEKITAMQAGLEGTPEWMVGEQLKEICADLDCAGLVEQDLAGDGMGLKECAAKIKAYADEQRKTTKANCVCVPPNVAEAEKAKQDLEIKAKNLEAKLKDAKAAVRQAKAEVQAAKENPEVPENVMEAIRAEAEAAVAEKAAQEAAARLAQAEKERAAAEERAKEASAALEEARKQAALSSPDAAVFKVVFTQVQEDFNRRLGTLKKITDPDMTEKLTAAVEKLLETMGQRVRA